VLNGQELKTLRSGCNITVREVENASRRIADFKGDRRFCISNGWLAQLENGASSEPSFFKLFSLSVIYRVSLLDLLRLYNVDVDEKEKYEHVADPYLTQIISDNHEDDGPSADLATRLVPASETRNGRGDNRESSIIYGHLGLTDFTMYPMIRPGAVLKIDTRQNKVASNSWRNEFERPIFFIELREAYACGWCEQQANQLLIIPHHSSPASVRRFTYPREAEIVGRVISYSTPCVDSDLQPEHLRKVKALTGRR
jgi:transcriptional regulator with XRE-family HTH domain